MYHIADIEFELMRHCLKVRGKWWANHLFRNKAVNDLYASLRVKSLDQVFKCIQQVSP